VILALLLAAAEPAPITAIDAERAFAADAQKIGQWTAFRKWSTADALMFTPQPVNAHAFFKDFKDPPVPVYWWPGRSYVSCDGTVAVNTGPWVRNFGKSVGYFTTIWKRQPDGGWKWIYDAGDELKTPRAEGGDIKVVKASCSPGAQQSQLVTGTRIGAQSGRGESVDRTISWFWESRQDGSRILRVNLWNGSLHKWVIEDDVAAAPK